MNDNLVDITDEYRKPKIDTDGFVDITDQYLANSKRKAAVAAGGDGLVDITNEYLSHDFPKQPSPQATRKGIIEPLPADMEAYKKAYEAGDDITYQSKPLDLTPPPDKNIAGVYAGQPPTGIPKLTLKGIKDVGVAAGRGLAEGLTVDLPSMTGKSLQYLGELEEGDPRVGKALADWAEGRRKEWFGDDPQYSGIERWAYEGSKMLGPSIIPGATITTATRLATGVNSVLKAAKLAEAAGDIVKAAELLKDANTLANKALNIGTITTGALFGTSTAQQVKDTAKEKGVDAGYAPEVEGLIEAIGESIGTKYLGTMLGLDKNTIKITLGNFIKTLGVETSTEFFQQLGQSATDKYQGIRPDAKPLEEAVSVIGPTIFMTGLTAGFGKGAELLYKTAKEKEQKEVTDKDTTPTPKVEAKPKQVTLTPVEDILKEGEEAKKEYQAKKKAESAQVEKEVTLTPVAAPAPEAVEKQVKGAEWFDLKAMTDTVAEPERFDISMPAGEQAVDEGFDITTSGTVGAYSNTPVPETGNTPVPPKPRGLIPTEEIWDKTPMDVQDEWSDAVIYAEEIKQEAQTKIQSLQEESRGLKGKENAQRKKDINAEIEKLKQGYEGFFAGYENAAMDESLKMREAAIEKARAKGLVDEDKLEEFATEFLSESSTERPYIEYNYNKTIQQIFDEVIGGYVSETAPEAKAVAAKQPEPVGLTPTEQGQVKPTSPAKPKEAWEMTKGEWNRSNKEVIPTNIKVGGISYLEPNTVTNKFQTQKGILENGETVFRDLDANEQPVGNWHKLVKTGRKILTKEEHKIQINQALSEGKPVPAEVLKDYPDLQPKAVVDANVYGMAKGEGAAGFTPDKEFRREAEAASGTETAEPQKRSDIVNFLQEKLGLPLKVGRFRGGNKGVLGIFKVKQEVIRTKLANDIETISHEVGHALEKYLWPETRDKKGNLTGTAFKDFAGELNDIASKPRKGQPTEPEGFAEFVRLYITDEAKAIEKAPNFYNYFEKELQTRAPEVWEILHQARADFNRWVNQPSMARVLGQISIGENKKPARDVDTLLKEAYTAVVDDLFPLRKIVQEMTGKEELPAAKDPYKLARLLRGWWGKAEAFLEYKPFDYNTYEWKGKSLKAILEPVKDNLDEFRAYIVSKRALELQARGIESGILPQDAKKIISDFDKKYSGTLSELIEYQDSLLRYLRDSGVIIPRDFARMKQANRDYVPFYRVFEGETAKGAGKGMEAQDPIKRMKGSWRDIVDPLESIVKNTYLFINVAERNSVGRALVDLANSKEGMGKFVEKIPAPMRSVKVGVDEVLGKWAEKIDDPHLKEMLKDMNLSDETVSIFRPSAFVPKENVISVWEKGKRNLYEVDPDIARAFQALDKESMNSIVRLLSYPARWLRAGATLTPEFIARNPIRDQFSAFVYSKYGYVPIWDLTKGIFDVAKGNDIYWQWKKSGGEHSMLVSLDRDYLQKNLEKVMQSKMEGIKDIIKNPIEALRIVSELGEAATRVGEFKRGVKKEGLTKAGMQEAAFSSREVTLDFARIGAKTKAVNAIIAFWNAQVQGTDRMIRAFKDRPWQTSFKVMAGITLPSVILAIVNHDDERWKEIPQWQKDIFWIIMTKNHIYRIPKPFELGIIFGTVPERMVDHILSKNPRAFDGLLKTLQNGAAPGIIPTAAIPFIENWANKSFFTDRPIVPRSKEGLPAEYQYQPYTTETAKKLGEVLSRITGEDSSMASPAKIENAIRGLSGGLGNHILKLADMALRKSGVLPDRIKPTKTLSDIPFIKAFVVRYPANDAESIQRFYDDYDKAKQTLAAAKELIKEGEGEKATALLSSRNIVRLDNIGKALQKSHKLIDSIYYNQTMTSDEKRQLIDKTYLEMIAIAKSGNEIMDKAEAVNE